MMGLAAATIVTLCGLAILGFPILVALAASVLVFLSFSGGWMLAMPQQALAPGFRITSW